MAIRGLKASLEGIKKAEQALVRNSLNKTALARELGIVRSTVSRFFKPEPVERLNFEEICTRLGLDWRDIIANPLTETETEEKEQSNPHFQDAQPELSLWAIENNYEGRRKKEKNNSAFFNYRFPITNYQLPITNSQFPIPKSKI